MRVEGDCRPSRRPLMRLGVSAICSGTVPSSRWGHAAGLRSYRGFVAVLVVIVLSVATPGSMSAAGAHGSHSEFADVPVSGTHSAAIADLARTGVLDGTECDSGGFCPEEPMRRWVMAVWLVRALDGGDPVGGVQPRFGDVGAGEWWAAHTERLAELGVTKGCSADPMLFCPEDAVTRAQMATFLVRAFALKQAAPAGFGDTAGTVHAASIDALAGAGVTVGCSSSPLRYCPHDPVTRAQMATFLVRARGSVSVAADPPASASYRIAYNVWRGPNNIPDWDTPRDNPETGLYKFRASYYRSFTMVRDLDSSDQETVVLESGLWPEGRLVLSPDRWNPDVIEWLPDGRPFTRAVNRSFEADAIYEWSPDGRHLSYRYGDLRIFNTEDRILYPFGGTCTSFLGWSPDGKYAAMYSSDGSGHKIVSVDGRIVAAMRDTPAHIDKITGWSPDGQVAYRTFEGVWVANPDLTGARRISDGYDLIWSSDGKKMVYSAYPARTRRDYRSNYYPQDIWVADADGTNARRVYTATRNVRLRQIFFGSFIFRFSPNGRYVAHRDYGSDYGSTFDYVVTSVDGSGSNPLRGEDETKMHGFYGWSSNGRHLAYSTYADPDRHSLWIANGDGSNAVMIAESDADRRGPPIGWSPDGKHIAYTVTTWHPDNPDNPPIMYTEAEIGYHGRVAHTNGDISHEVWVAHTDGSSPMKIADGWFDSWSPDGRLLAYRAGIDYRYDGLFIVNDVATRDGEVWVVESDGSNPVLLTENVLASSGSVTWSLL